MEKKCCNTFKMSEFASYAKTRSSKLKGKVNEKTMKLKLAIYYKTSFARIDCIASLSSK